MNRDVLIIGGSEAGIQAAMDLADSGVTVHLVEPSPFLGQAYPTRLPAHVYQTRILEAARHPRVTVRTHTDVAGLDGRPGDFKVRLRQNPRYVDLAKCTACGDCVEACPVHVPGTDRKAVYLAEPFQPGCAVVDKAGKAPCAHACPGGIHVQGYVALTAEGRFREAMDLIREAIPFPGICGRICTHPCEINCRRNEIDSPVSIRLLKRFLSDWETPGEDDTKPSDMEKPEQPHPQTGKKVAVIGAGPAGMTAAGYLADQGHTVTVFEKLPVIGGMLAVGIPAYRLPRDIIAREYELIRKRGVGIRLRTPVGPGEKTTMADLFSRGYEAVCLTVGAHQSLSLGIPGEELNGVIQGIDFLKQLSLVQQAREPDLDGVVKTLLPRGKNTRAAVLGGGNTAMDVSRTLRRLGLSDVRILYRRTRKEMPALEEEIEETEREGVKIHYLTAPKSIFAKPDGWVKGIECLQMELGEPDAGGRRRPVPVPGKDHKMDLDLVVLAIGQQPDFRILDKEDRIEVSKEWRIQVDPVHFMTGRAGVFAAGDAVTRDRMSAIEAIGMGKKMARAVNRFLNGEDQPAVSRDSAAQRVSERALTPEEQVPVPARKVPVLPVKQRMDGFDEVELGYSKADAVKEASRCLKCGPCSECMACVRVCKAGAVMHDQVPNLTEISAGSIIYAGDPEKMALPACMAEADMIQVIPDDPLTGSAAAAGIKAARVTRIIDRPFAAADPGTGPDENIGIYLCRCGDDMGGVIRIDRLKTRLGDSTRAGCIDVLSFACGPDGADRMRQGIEKHGLNRVVLAACSCCSSNQVCYSCTFQRIRCKEKLGIYGAGGDPLFPAAVEFVNIREQCAWVHRDDPDAATDKAHTLIRGAVTRLREAAFAGPEPMDENRSVMIIGGGRAAGPCVDELKLSGITASLVLDVSSPVEYSNGRYQMQQNGRTLESVALILNPRDETEKSQIIDRLCSKGAGLGMVRPGDSLETNRPGIFYCDPERDPVLLGRAVAARCRGWMDRTREFPAHDLGRVDPHLCRVCYTCVDTCETGAPQIRGDNSDRHVWIDTTVCTGCGACAAGCPSNAIRAGDLTDTQMENMIMDMLAHGRTERE